uniref:Uncharacterized protein n=1 Tax=viral metagenome TaxID=1070528 RepID=A0A6M3JTI5_9ZZZZ
MNLFESEPMKIGKHQWRVTVYTHPSYGNCSEYEWRYDEHDRWKSMREWPRYDSNDGMYSGCPRTLVKLYFKNKPDIDKHLIGS